ncbi:MAG TPA: MBL fold metallo-hydrolase [Syntrophales bacterium]|nr:MBL fold metallo-hydrolase [Syntrophales bacterium]HPQ43466.1 MBL fold metallo-hydrolase [Syntrophales bacterium]
MKLTIIYDNETDRQDLKADWGFACLVEAHERNILFDTGANGDILLDNMKALGIKPSSVSDVVISHDHWDHTGGLDDFLKENSDINLYIPSSYSVPSDWAREIIVVKEPIRICEGVFSTGELRGVEQSLIVSTNQGSVIITGCSHPGVKDILEAASTHGKIHAVIGGLHGFNELRLLEEISAICATHCTEYKAEIQFLYPDAYIEGGAGRIIEI